MKKPQNTNNNIATNKKASYDYFFEQTFEAGLELMGWEVKSLRGKKINLVDSYVVLKNGEAFLIGCHITPLKTASSHIFADPIRTRKLLLHKKEISKLIGSKERKGYTIIATKLYWKKHLIKCSIAVAQGKKEFDKRQSLKEKDMNREILRSYRKDTKKNFAS